MKIDGTVGVLGRRAVGFGFAAMSLLILSLSSNAAGTDESNSRTHELGEPTINSGDRTAPDWRALLQNADKLRGAEISAKGVNGGPPCKSCHGPASSRKAGLPRLAGLNASYVARELFAFANGLRRHEEMRAAAMFLKPQDMADLGAYYSTLRPAANGTTSTIMGNGALIHIHGAHGVTPCSQCHGVDATGADDEAPPLAGQEPSYVVEQLRAFADGTRKSRSAMNEVAARLSEDERLALAEFYAGLPPRGAAP